MQQALRHGLTWTIRLPGESLEEWFARVPGSESALDGDCDHYTPWKSGGQIKAVCTKCGDTSPTACEAAHNEAVAFFKGKYPEDP